MNTFDRYAPFLQDYIYRQGWQSLRGVQVAAADALFNTDDHVLLCASTASGKTEAAFFPILTKMLEDPPASVGALYIGPLKALINDQFERLDDLCKEAGIPVWHWHGDVAASHKNKLLKNPSGILLITPESLEALLIHKHAAIPKLFGDLCFVVIDEVHSLLRGDRGGQTLCLIERLSRIAGVKPRRIGLSATLGDPESVGKLLAEGTGRRTVIPKIESKGVRWRLSMEHFYVQGAQAASNAQSSTAQDGDVKAICEKYAMQCPEAPTDRAPAGADPGFGYIFEHTRGRKCLVFVNSREECEAVTTSLRSYSEAAREEERFYIHHGNLSASIRQSAEENMKDPEKLASVVTTATLELGIDVGRLERAFQIDAPWTVSSFLQRMGRTGRRDQCPEMWFVMREDEPEARAMLPSTVPWKLLQGIALVQLYLEERWVEPARLDRFAYSLLYHQTMSELASSGEMSPAELAARILTLPYFRRVSKEDFKQLLLHLIGIGHIERTENNGLIVGINGERVISSYKFYGVFVESEEYTVRCESLELGTLCLPPPPGEKIAIAGQVWIVEEVDRKRKLVYCQPVKGKVPAYFGECPGDLHTKILERMKRVLEEDAVYPYLMQNALTRLLNARKTANLSGILENPLIPLGGKMYCLLPWLGTYAFLALERLLRIKCAQRVEIKGFDSARPYYMQFLTDAEPKDLLEIVAEEAEKLNDPMELLYPDEVPEFDKYDSYLPDGLLRKSFALGVLDVAGMKARVSEWAGSNRKNMKMIEDL